MTEPKNGVTKIGDLVEVPEIRTVVQLKDLEDQRLRQMISDSFVVTAEVARALRAVFTSISKGQGKGVFIKGHFGSGKSHFLSMLYLLLTESVSWQGIVSQEPSLSDLAQALSSRQYVVVNISLVQYRSSEFLEDIVLKSITASTDIKLEASEGRKDAFEKIRHYVARGNFSGMVLLIDELSEFLRSKPNARSYNEDIRFLQFLGEEAASFPLWIVASLQEWIEETGEISQDTFNKIKDRYPLRLSLGRAHIEELVSHRLIRKRPGAEDKIREIFTQVRSAFPTFPVTEERFLSLYPIHPATCSLLDRLKPLFSEHRGVVDFIHFRLRGDPERNIPCSLEWPAHQLIGPEAIFDHFLERIKERVDTQIYVERVYGYFEMEIPELFKDEEQQRVAYSLIKLLVLFAISPVKFRYTVRHVAEMVLFQITSLDAQINYQFIHDILEKLHREGSYIGVDERPDPLENHYFIDLKADIAGIMRSRVRHMASEIFPADRRLFTRLAPMVNSPYLPLAGWLERGKEEVSVLWQHTQRKGIFYLRQLNDIEDKELESLAQSLDRSEEDYLVFVGTTHGQEEQYDHVKKHLIPMAQSRFPARVMFWVPAAIGHQVERLKEVLAAWLLLDKIKSEGTGGRVEEQEKYLKNFLEREAREVTEIFLRAYFEGMVLWDENEADLARLGRLTREKFLAEFIRPMLERRFPKHGRIRPYMDLYLTDFVKQMLREFLSTGVMAAKDRSKAALRNLLEGVLRPMGLVRKKGERYELHVHAQRNELAREFFTKMKDRQAVALEEIYWELRKGEYGLLMPQFEILVLALAFSGHLVAYKAMNRKGLQELVRTGLKGVSSLGRGEILGQELQEAMALQPLIPKKYLQMPFTFSLQEELWGLIKSEKPKALEELNSLRSRIEWARSFQAFRNLPWDQLSADLERVVAQWEEVKTSFGSKEGLERFIRAGQGEPLLGDSLARIRDAQGFLDKAERILFIYQYVTDPRLKIPSDESYTELSELHGELIGFFNQPSGPLSVDLADELFRLFDRFHRAYLRAYAGAHHSKRGPARFEEYERIKQSRPYKVLRRLDQLEMVSVQHDFRHVEDLLAGVLLKRCERAVQDQLQAQPVCRCGFTLGESSEYPLPGRIREDIEAGIRETLDALASSEVQERLIPYMRSLELVGKNQEAEAIRELLSISPEDAELLEKVERALRSGVIEGINEAFRGKVVVVERDLDELYNNLVHRKYTLKQARQLLSQWLEGESISGDTFIHFIGGRHGSGLESFEEELKKYLERTSGPHKDIYRELGPGLMARAAVVALWAEQYELNNEDIIRLLPFLDRGGSQDNTNWLQYFRTLGRRLMAESPGLFEKMVSRVEEDQSFCHGLWAQISNLSPKEIFLREQVSHYILREAFERLIEGTQGDLDLTREADDGHQRGTALSTVAEQSEKMVEALRLKQEIHKKAEALLSCTTAAFPKTYRAWEIFYTKTMSPLPSMLARLSEILRAVASQTPPWMDEQQRTIIKAIEKTNAYFSEFYEQNLVRWQGQGEDRPTMVQDIPGQLKGKRNVPDHRDVRYLLMDGMRWDLWGEIKARFFGKKGQYFRIVREGALWAHYPTDTPTQMEQFEQELARMFPHKDPADLVIKATGIDERIHSEKGSITQLFSGVLGYLETELFYRLRDLPSGTLLILFADHGFVENPDFAPTAKYDSPRYIHGGMTPFEVIVPWAWVMRI